MRCGVAHQVGPRHGRVFHQRGHGSGRQRDDRMRAEPHTRQTSECRGGVLFNRVASLGRQPRRLEPLFPLRGPEGRIGCAHLLSC